MAHLEGVLTLVSDTGPWFRIQGRHLRDVDAPRVGLRVMLDPASGVTVDVHLGAALWVRAGWYPAHLTCVTPVLGTTTTPRDHRCWGRWLTPRVIQTPVVRRRTA